MSKWSRGLVTTVRYDWPDKRRKLPDYLGIFLLFSALFPSGLTKAQAAPEISETRPTIMTTAEVELSLDALEKDIWMAESFRLSALEKQAVRGIQINPYSAKAHGLLSQILMRRFSLDPSQIQLIRQASDLAQQAIDLDPELDIGYVALASLFDLMGTPDRGLQLLSEIAAAGLAPSWRIYFTRARLTSEATDTKQVLGLLRNAMSFKDAHQAVIAPYVVAVLLSSRSGGELIRDLRSWRSDFPNGSFDATLAEVLADHGRAREAHQIYRHILKRNPSSHTELVSDSVLLYRSLNSPQQAIAQIQQAIRQQGADDPLQPMVLGHLGAAYLANHQYDEARLAFRKAVRLTPKDASLLQFIVEAYQTADLSVELDTMLTELNHVAPGHGFLHAVLGENLSEKLGKHQLALSAFDNAIVLEPNRSDFYTGRGTNSVPPSRHTRSVNKL